MIRILAADDHKIMTEGISAMISQNEEDMIVVATAKNGQEVIQLLSEKEIDIVLLDIQMPKMDGIETAKIVKQDFPDIKILVLSMFLDQVKLDQILQEEISGYVLKDKGYDEIINAIRTIIDGREYYSNEIVELIVSSHRQALHSPKEAGIEVRLTEKEQVVLKMLSEGKNNPEIAKKLNKSIHTINSHVKNIKSKLGIHSVRELVSFAIKNENLK